MSKLTILLASNSMENFYHALVLSMDAKSMGWDSKVFVTSDAVVLFTKESKGNAKPSMGALAGIYVKMRLRKIGISETTKMLRQAMQIGVEFFVDEIGLKIAGLSSSQLMEGVKLSGGISFLQEARESDVVVTL